MSAVVHPPLVASDSTALGVVVLALVVVAGALLATLPRWLPAIRARLAARSGGARPRTEDRWRARMRAMALRDRHALGDAAEGWLIASWLVAGVAALVLVLVWVPKVALEVESRVGVSAYEQGDYERAVQIFENHEDRDPAAWRAAYDEGTAFLAWALTQGDPASDDFVVWYAEDAESKLDRAFWSLDDGDVPPTAVERCQVTANARTAKLLLADAAEAELARDPEAYFASSPDELRAEADDLGAGPC
ncbi:hypothetical protein AAG589_16725 [Isoptericola sp. F-RaC21]|uniref:hypothetical protein n=1 Tax=Isoptericola sp. F-RaC21 TaxID=3141452 RepID=UPI00315C4AF7